MRKIIFGLLFILAGAANALGQSTTVSGNVTDTGSQAWAGGTYQFQFAPNPQFPTGPYTWTGGTLNKVISGTLDGSGNYSVSIPSNTAISPQGSKWILQVTPNATSPSFSTPPTTITGGTQTLNATPPAVTTPPTLFARAYADSEITGATLGSQYFNVTTLLVRVCTVVTGLSCTTWANVGSGGGGGGTVTGTGVANQVAFWTAASAIGGNTNLTFDPVALSFVANGGASSVSFITAGPTQGNGLTVTSSGTSITSAESGAVTQISADSGVLLQSSTGGVSLGIIGEATPLNFVGSSSGEGTLSTNATASAITSTVPLVFSGCALGGQSDRSVAGTTDTILAADRCNRVVYTSATAVAVTLPQAGTTGFANSFFYTTSDGGAGAVTITPTPPSTINGNTTLVLNEGDACRIGPNSTGASYAADCAPPQLVAGTGITLTPAVHSLTIASTGSGISGLTTGVIPQAGSSTTIVNSSPQLDNGVSTANTLTYAGSGGVSSPRLISTVATGTAPLTVTSTTNVANLNASSLGGATFAAPGPIGSTTASTGAFTTLGATGQGNFSGAGAASTASVNFTGTVFTGGNGTTTFPNVYLNYGTAPTTFNTSGTILGINSPSGFAGLQIDIHPNGAASVFTVSSGGSVVSATGNITATAGNLAAGGSVTAGAGSGFFITSRSKLQSGADGRFNVTQNSGGAFTRFTFGPETTASPAFTISGTNINTTLGDGTAGGTLTAGNLPAMSACGTTSTCANTAISTNAKIIIGSAPLVTGAPSTVTITGISPAFTSSTSYVCTIAGQSSATTGLYSVANVSGSSFTITGPASTTTVVNYICAGN